MRSDARRWPPSQTPKPCPHRPLPAEDPVRPATLQRAMSMPFVQGREVLSGRSSTRQYPTFFEKEVGPCITAPHYWRRGELTRDGVVVCRCPSP